ncbi:2TM domain-containing protein [Winogradskyella sp. PG-2]|uniref:2TM domain-containing protein n=1 Tax=Winogradskyella sp. PG-2 TaxID=754409 RepID=UPI0004587A0C|nr:2TM domain-containing protein [Winogradskyella sp. PG-2]BAO74247.1 hypothetical protein WPG_0017 [Winogradskyella sp. PG-2]
MELDKEQQLLANAKKKLKRVKILYMHLALYIIAIVLILYNFYIIDEGSYKNNIISLNLSVIVAWTVFVIIHSLNVFKERLFFKSSWEDKKMKEFTKEEEEVTKRWE